MSLEKTPGACATGILLHPCKPQESLLPKRENLKLYMDLGNESKPALPPLRMAGKGSNTLPTFGRIV